MDPEQKAEREGQRRDKIQQGLDELERRLTDIVRGGLASALNQSYKFWDETARRLVDAQAPGIARRARELGGITAKDPRWAETLLGKMGRLKLLIEAWRRIQNLSPGEQADLRSAAGWPVSKEEVLAGEGVSDAWRVMAVTLEEDEESHIRTQRVWLWGAGTKQAALLLEFAHRTQPLTWLLPPGNTLEAELVYFPGAGHRALIKERKASMESTAQVTGYGSIEEAMEAHARGLETCPWIEAFPMLLETITPARGREEWQWIDAAGQTVPVGLPDRLGWKYFAESGGAPIQVFGEWLGDYFMPLPAEMNFDCSASKRSDLAAPMMGEFARSVMLEVSRQSLPNVFPDGPFKSFLESIKVSSAPEEAVLKTAGALDAGLRMGRVPVEFTGKLPEPAPAETFDVAPAAASALLARMLDGELEGLTAEWLAHAADHRRRVRSDLLPKLLTKGERESDLREPMGRAGGARAKWLAQFRPEWQWVTRGTMSEAEPDVRLWDEGDRQERVGYLRQWRALDPGRAREKLAETFAKEAAPDRQAFLAELRNGLASGDEPMLTEALADRSANVRQMAAELLSALPASAFARRMLERLAVCVTFNKKLLGKSMTIEPPETLDARSSSDGLTEKPPGKLSFGEKGWWLAQIISFTPLDFWSERTGGMEPDAILGLMVKSDWWKEVTWGLMQAATRQGSADWGPVLLVHKKNEWENAKMDLFARLPAAQRIDLTMEALKTEKMAAVGMAYLQLCPRPWSPELSRLALAVMRRIAAKQGLNDWTLSATFVDFAGALAREVLAESVEGWDHEAAAFKYLTGKPDHFMTILQTRKTMIEVFRDE